MQIEKYYVYIATDDEATVFHVGIATDLKKRIRNLRAGNVPLEIKQYNIEKIVYIETYKDPDDAMKREEELKRLSNIKLSALSTTTNPQLKDLS